MSTVEPTAEMLVLWATSAIKLLYATRELQADPANAALLRAEQHWADVVLDTAFSLVRANWKN